jgi:hypothetical protein
VPVEASALEPCSGDWRIVFGRKLEELFPNTQEDSPHAWQNRRRRSSATDARGGRLRAYQNGNMFSASLHGSLYYLTEILSAYHFGNGWFSAIFYEEDVDE